MVQKDKIVLLYAKLWGKKDDGVVYITFSEEDIPSGSFEVINKERKPPKFVEPEAEYHNTSIQINVSLQKTALRKIRKVCMFFTH